MALSTEDHRKIAAEYQRLAGLAKTDKERDEFQQLAQEHLLLAVPDPQRLPPGD